MGKLASSKASPTVVAEVRRLNSDCSSLMVSWRECCKLATKPGDRGVSDGGVNRSAAKRVTPAAHKADPSEDAAEVNEWVWLFSGGVIVIGRITWNEREGI